MFWLLVNLLGATLNWTAYGISHYLVNLICAVINTSLLFIYLWELGG